MKEHARPLPGCSRSQRRRDLSRFLRARQWSVAGAVEMYQASQKWRASVSLPDLVDRSSPAYFDFHEVDAVARAGWSMYFHGIDKLGRPIFVQGLAGLDTTKLLQATTQERITLNFACTLETACQSRYREATLARRAKGDSEALIDGEDLGLQVSSVVLTQAQTTS